ncbi:hypothetical protein FC1_24260 [Flavobacterium columnare NBRC 100251 = ATCC 23463]|nr:hypothetical protein FC1_24260 [Flavobacterium columnare NBRC 100251 = ATCC 23463]
MEDFDERFAFSNGGFLIAFVKFLNPVDDVAFLTTAVAIVKVFINLHTGFFVFVKGAFDEFVFVGY